MRVNLAQFIKFKMLEYGEVSPFQVWRETRGRYKYLTVARYFHVLRKLGLIVHSRSRYNSRNSPIMENFYRLAPGAESSPCWDYPWYCYWIKKGMDVYVPEPARTYLLRLLRGGRI